MPTTIEEHIQYLPDYMLENGVVKPAYADVAAQISQGIFAASTGMPPTEEGIFFALVANPEFAPTDENGDGELDESEIDSWIFSTASIAHDIDVIFSSGSATDKIMVALLIYFFESRKQSLQSRQQELVTSTDELFAAAKELIKAAKEAFAGAVLNAIITFVCAFLSVVLAATSLYQAKQGMTAQNSFSKHKAEASVAKNNMRRARNDVDRKKYAEEYKNADELKSKSHAVATKKSTYAENARLTNQTVSMSMNVAGGWGAAYHDKESKLIEAGAKILEAIATYLSGKKDQSTEFQQMFASLVAQIVQAVKDLRDAEAALQASLSRMNAS
jgi:hypothetical protein